MKLRQSYQSRGVLVGRILLNITIVGLVGCICVARSLFHVDYMLQIYATVAVLVGVAAYWIMEGNSQVVTTDRRRFNPAAIYQTELTTIYQLAQEYSPEDIARYRAIGFRQGDVKTFMNNLTEARIHLLKWEIAVRQSAYLTLIEEVTHGLDSAKRLIEEIRLQPRQMLEYGDFLYRDLPHLAVLSEEFLDLTQEQDNARKETLLLVRESSSRITETFENAQLEDVREVAQEAGESFHVEEAKAAARSSDSSDFERWKRRVDKRTPFAKITRKESLELPSIALVLSLLAMIWTPAGFMVMCGVLSLALVAYSLVFRFHERKPFAWLAAVLVVLFTATSVVGYVQDIQERGVAKKMEETHLPVLDYLDVANPITAKSWTFDDFMDLTLNDEDYNGTHYTVLLRIYGLPKTVYVSDTDSEEKEFDYSQGDNKGTVQLSFDGSFLTKKIEQGLGTQLPYKWTQADIDALRVLDDVDEWQKATSFNDIERKFGDPAEINASRDSNGKENYEMVYKPYDPDEDTDSDSKVTLNFIKVANGDYRLVSFE